MVTKYQIPHARKFRKYRYKQPPSPMFFLSCILSNNWFFWHFSYILLKLLGFILKFSQNSQYIPSAFAYIVQLKLRLFSNTISFGVIVSNNAASRFKGADLRLVLPQCPVVNINPNKVFKLSRNIFNIIISLFHSSTHRLGGFLIGSISK